MSAARRGAWAVLCALALLVSAPAGARAAGTTGAAHAKAPPPAPGNPEFAWLVAIENLPADSVGRAAFLSGFQGGFAENTLKVERYSQGAKQWLPTVPISNRFRLLQGTDGEGAWQVYVTLEWEPPLTKGVTVVVPTTLDSVASMLQSTLHQPINLLVTLLIHSPAMVAANARPQPERVLLSLTAPREPRDRFERGVGADVARLVLERLHQLHEDMRESDRVTLVEATRGDLATLRTAPPAERPARH